MVNPEDGNPISGRPQIEQTLREGIPVTKAKKIYTAESISEIQSLVQTDGLSLVRLKSDKSYSSDTTLTINANNWDYLDRDIHIYIPYWRYTGTGRAIEVKNNDGYNNFQGRVSVYIGDLVGPGPKSSGTRAIVTEDFTGLNIYYGSIRDWDYGIYGQASDSQCENLTVEGKKIRNVNYPIRLEGDAANNSTSFDELYIDTKITPEEVALYFDEVMLGGSEISGASFTEKGVTGWYLNLVDAGFRASRMQWRFDGPGGTDIVLKSLGSSPPAIATFAFKNTHQEFNDPNDLHFPHFREKQGQIKIYDRSTEIRRRSINQRTYSYNSSNISGFPADESTWVTVPIDVTSQDTYEQANTSEDEINVEYAGDYFVYGQARISGINDGDTAHIELRVNGTRQLINTEILPDYGTATVFLPNISLDSNASVDMRVQVNSSNPSFTIRGGDSETLLYIQQIA